MVDGHEMVTTKGKPAWMNKHPCAGCRTGYVECAQGWRLNLQCCKNCDHPGMRSTHPAFTDEEIKDMWRRAEGRTAP